MEVEVGLLGRKVWTRNQKMMVIVRRRRRQSRKRISKT